MQAKAIRWISDGANVDGRLSKCERFLTSNARSSSSYAYEILPKMAGRFAPVAEVTFDGRRCQVS